MIQDTESLYLPDCVLDFTEGKRALIVGGQGARPEAKNKIEKVFDFAVVDWFYGERGGDTMYMKACQSILMGKYDVVLLLTNFSSHSSMNVVREAKRCGVQVVMIPAGYSPNAISTAIDNQVCRKLPQKTTGVAVHPRR